MQEPPGMHNYLENHKYSLATDEERDHVLDDVWSLVEVDSPSEAEALQVMLQKAVVLRRQRETTNGKTTTDLKIWIAGRWERTKRDAAIAAVAALGGADVDMEETPPPAAAAAGPSAAAAAAAGPSAAAAAAAGPSAAAAAAAGPSSAAAGPSAAAAAAAAAGPSSAAAGPSSLFSSWQEAKDSLSSFFGQRQQEVERMQRQLEDRERQLEDRERQLQERERQVAEREQRVAGLPERERQLQERERLAAAREQERSSQRREAHLAQAQLAEALDRIAELESARAADHTQHALQQRRAARSIEKNRQSMQYKVDKAQLALDEAVEAHLVTVAALETQRDEAVARANADAAARQAAEAARDAALAARQRAAEERDAALDRLDKMPAADL